MSGLMTVESNPFLYPGSAQRYDELLERDGSMQLSIPYSRARKVARMTIRSKEDVQALKNQVQQQERAQARM